jgi:DNA (cytosine-5)-methyltransferase 1
MTHLGLFEGIGGFSLAAKRMGWRTKVWCEINPFCQKVLKHHFPKAEGFGDIKKTDFTKYANTIDILTGGFPCQPYSVAGARKGKEDERHLWPEMLRTIREVQPRWIVGENVRGIVNWNGGMVFDEVQADLENEGYKILPFLLPSVGIGANNIRERIWFIAYSNSMGRKNVQNNFTSSTNKVRNLQSDWTENKRWEKETSELDSSSNSFLRFSEMYGQPPIFSVDDELPFRLVGSTVPKWIENSMIAVGNSINPKVALQIFKAIEQYEMKINL